MKIENITLENMVNAVDYANLYKNTIPSTFALEFVNFIKLANDGEGEENKTPLIHYDMLDQLEKHRYNLFVAFRGSAKTSVLHEYLTLYIATYGGLPFKGFENIDVGMYVSDTMDNGIKNFRRNLEYRWEKSEFLRTYIPKVNLTEDRWEFINAEDHKYCVRGFGATTGVRGFKEYGKRPSICGMDDLLSDQNASSPTILANLETVIYGAARQALHPTKRMMIWTGTPFNKKDPLYKAAGSRSWNTRVYPVCEKFPCDKEEFVGAWDDRFNYSWVYKEYLSLLEDGKIDMFNRELMLRLVSDDDRLVKESDMPMYSRDDALNNLSRYNTYITTDFAVSDKIKADYSAIGVWAYTYNRDWLLLDGIHKRQLMDKNVEDLFMFVHRYKPMEVGIEISGQQKGFISWLFQEMVRRNIYFKFASDKNSAEPGLRPAKDKFTRFNTVVPWFKAKKIWLPKELRDDQMIVNFIDEITNVTTTGIKSKTDDLIDITSQLALLNAWTPSAEQSGSIPKSQDIYGDDIDNSLDERLDSYIV